MVTLTLDKIEHGENRINILSINDVAWLLGIDIEAAQRWVDAGIIETCPITNHSQQCFRREDVAKLLARLGV
jgi:predicted site-specific integrase-resolvase